MELTRAVRLQRKCACGSHASGECEACRKKRPLLQRYDRGRPGPLARRDRSGLAAPAGVGVATDLSGVALRGVSALPKLETPLRLQRRAVPDAAPAPAESAAVPASDASPEEDAETLAETAPVAAPEPAAVDRPATLIVADDAAEVEPEQLRKTEFLDRLETAVCAEADAALSATGQSTDGCPFLADWFDHYRSQSSAHIESDLQRYAPDARNARTATDYIPLVAARVRQGVERWASTGEITGVPEGIPLTVPAVEGAGSLISGIGRLFFKARAGGARAADDPEAIRHALGSGSPLESGVRSRMERAFGRSFAHVQTHTDATARHLSSDHNARAFTVGEHVAFGAGEYRPGTPVGDALVAHELAHVVQQSGAVGATQTRSSDGASYGALERDADDAAVGAVAALWGGAKGALNGIAQYAVPGLKSGLRLSRCSQETCESGNKTIDVDLVKLHGSNRSPTSDLAESNKIFKGCCVKFNKVKAPSPESETVTESWLGGDTDVDLTGITCSTPTAEEKNLYDEATRKHSLTSRMRVFYVQSASGYPSRAFSRPPYCGGGYENHAIVYNSASRDTLAHEFGHILLNRADHTGIDDPSDTSNLMVSPSRTGSKLDASQCKIIYNNA